MKRYLAASLILIPILAFTYNCSSLRQPARKTDYYTLEYAPPEYPSKKVLPQVIRIDRFQVAPSFASNNIVYRDGPNKLDAYTYHHWRANPGDLVTYFLARDFEHAALFEAAYSLKGRLDPTYVLEGVVDGFHEDDGPEKWQAVIILRVTLLKKNEPDISKRIAFQRRYAAAEDCHRKHPQALAEAMSRAMARVSARIITDTHDYLSGISP